jgi:hypothetical protein
MAHRDLRRNPRTLYSGAVLASWSEPNGDPKFARARCIDLSGDGLRLELPVPITVRTVVSLRFDRIHLSGTASVRHVRRNGMKFVVGFELSQHLSQQVANNPEILQPLSTSAAS